MTLVLRNFEETVKIKKTQEYKAWTDSVRAVGSEINAYMKYMNKELQERVELGAEAGFAVRDLDLEVDGSHDWWLATAQRIYGAAVGLGDRAFLQRATGVLKEGLAFDESIKKATGESQKMLGFDNAHARFVDIQEIVSANLNGVKKIEGLRL